MKPFTHWTCKRNINSFVGSCVDKEMLSGPVIRLLIGAIISIWTLQAGGFFTPTRRCADRQTEDSLSVTN